MSNRIPASQYDALLRDAGKLLGLQEDLAFKDQCCALQFGAVAVNLQRDDVHQRIVMSGYLLELPRTVAQATLELLLAANLYWQSGATVCLEPQSRSLLMLHPEAMHGLTARGLLERLQKFAESVGTARAKLAERIAAEHKAA